MTESDIIDVVKKVSRRAERLRQLGEILNCKVLQNAKMCIFFDEINTSSQMGILKEVICDHTINAEAIPKNVIIIAACNPAREKMNIFSNRKQEFGIEWVSGHYQTHPLPHSIERMVWDYGSLTTSQEKEFIYKKL